MARMEISGTCYTAQEDVKEFFYRLGIGPELARYFGLPPVRVGLLVDALGSEAPSELLGMEPGSTFSPCLSVLPMGFSYAFCVAQQVHLHIASVVLGSDGLLVDRAPPPRIEAQHDTAHMIYADNASQFGLDLDIVTHRRELLSQALNGRGLDTH